jgi:hypothetical protein
MTAVWNNEDESNQFGHAVLPMGNGWSTHSYIIHYSIGENKRKRRKKERKK